MKINAKIVIKKSRFWRKTGSDYWFFLLSKAPVWLGKTVTDPVFI